MKKYLKLSCGLLFAALTLTACSDSDSNSATTSDYTFSDNVRISSTISQKTSFTTSDYSDKSYGNAAIDNCEDLADELVNAANLIIKSKSGLSDTQEDFLKNLLATTVDQVIVPTYTKLADETEILYNALNGLSLTSLKQAHIDNACDAFKNARMYWEKSEAFLGGPASDFNIDPTIDSWPLNRSLLLNYLASGATDFTDEQLDDASILGFHALEFLLFRDGKNRDVDEFAGYDTYKGFENISGTVELAYAQRVCELLYQRCCQLQVAWEGETTANADRVAVVKAAGLDYTTTKGFSYGDNMKNAGTSNSTFSNVTTAIEQLLSMEEGSAYGICNEVGTAKIANPFSAGDVSYVESPYSYNSITDFQNNIRSIQNVWFGNTDGTDSGTVYSFHNFFKSYGGANVNTNVENAIVNAINGIGSMPPPFVKYVCTIWGITNFADVEIPEE